MSKFKPNEFKVLDNGPKDGGVRVLKGIEGPPKNPDAFVPNKLDKRAGQNYNVLKEKYGSLAATDPEMASRTQKNRRFSVSSLVKGPLQIEAEEMRALDDRVTNRVIELTAVAQAEGHEKGYAEGLERGTKLAFEKFKIEADARIRDFENLVMELEGAKREIYRANERFLLEVVFRIARMVTLKELSTDKEYLVRLTAELIDRVGVRENIRVRIHPEDLATVSMLQEGLAKTMGTLKNLNIQAATSIKRGGCEVETEWNAIEASLETQLQGVRDALFGKEVQGN